MITIRTLPTILDEKKGKCKHFPFITLIFQITYNSTSPRIIYFYYKSSADLSAADHHPE